jgi:class 3 adenylate cyclase
LEGVCCDAKDPYAGLSDSNTLFDWERTVADLDSDYSKWWLDRAQMIYPDARPEDIELYIEYAYATASPAAHRFIWCCLMGFDIRPMLRHVTQPTLVIHATDDQLYPVQHGRYFAEHIPGASYIELDSNYHLPMYDADALPQLKNGIEKFIAGLPPRQSKESSARAVSTVLFTDIVDSTEQQRSLGDRVWTDKITAFEARSTDIVERCRGRVIRFTGDGIKAAFDVPGDCLRAARLLVQNANELGHPVRVGLHTGEIQWSGGDMHGLAVNIASRVADQADAGEVLTTNVTQGIVEGGDYDFTDWGEVDLKGIGTRKLVRLIQD